MATRKRSRENRQNPRIEVAKGVWVAWRTDGSPSVSRIHDLSLGGVFISTETPLPRDSVVHLLFSLPEGELRMEGAVRFSSVGKGMGIEFTRMGAADRARLQELIRRLRA